MPETFAAQSLVGTNISRDNSSVAMTFVDAKGARQTITLPIAIAGDLAPVLASLAQNANGRAAARFTKIPNQWAVGTARHERLVLITFDDDPPYGLAPEVAERLWRDVREGTEAVSRQGVPALQ